MPKPEPKPKLVLGFGSGFGTNFFDKKSYTKVSDKFLTLTGFDKKMSLLTENVSFMLVNFDADFRAGPLQ